MTAPLSVQLYSLGGAPVVGTGSTPALEDSLRFLVNEGLSNGRDPLLSP
jgi:hypothetical protein